MIEVRSDSNISPDPPLIFTQVSNMSKLGLILGWALEFRNVRTLHLT